MGNAAWEIFLKCRADKESSFEEHSLMPEDFDFLNSLAMVLINY